MLLVLFLSFVLVEKWHQGVRFKMTKAGLLTYNHFICIKPTSLGISLLDTTTDWVDFTIGNSRLLQLSIGTNLGRWDSLKRLNPFLTKTFVENEIYFTWKGWSNLFAIQEKVYKELCVEFFSTVTFQDNI